MLSPQIVDITDKGYVLLPAKLRRALGFKPKGQAYLLPDEEAGEVKIKPIKKPIIEELCGMFAEVDKGHSWTQELLEERRHDLIREEAKLEVFFKTKNKGKNGNKR